MDQLSAGISYTFLVIAVNIAMLASALALCVARRNWRARTGALMLLLSGGWVLTITLRDNGDALPDKLLWETAKLLITVPLPTLWLVFALLFSGYERKLSGWVLAFLSLAPAGAAALALTNDRHGLIWQSFSIDTMGQLDHVYGSGMWAFAAYSYAVLGAGIILTALMLLRSRRLYMWQSLAMLTAVFTVSLPFGLDQAGMDMGPPVTGMLMVLLGFVATIAWGFNRLRQSDIRPVARETVVENMSDPVLVLDADGRVMDINAAGRKLVCRDGRTALGKPAVQVLGSWSGDLPALDQWQGTREMTLGEDRRAYDVQCSPVRDFRGRPQCYIMVFRDITERKLAEDRIKYVSFHDKLTGLYNRAFFEEELARLDSPRQLPLTVVLGDVNGLKLINDVFGHDRGDGLLAKAATVLKECCRKEDIVARYGGDEFIILLHQTGPDHAASLCERIHEICRRDGRNGRGFELSLALGSATKEDPQQKIGSVLKAAEDRMYRNKLTESRSTRSALLSSLQQSLRGIGQDAEEHALRVQDLALRLGHEVGLSGSDREELAMLAMHHDIGVIVVPRSILEKPGPLTPEEWESIKMHPENGYRIATSCDELAAIAGAILAHHERWDGSGYPQGVRGQQIPLASRIIAVVDAYDAMRSARPYRPALSRPVASDEILRCAGTQFDPSLAGLFCHTVLRGAKV